MPNYLLSKSKESQLLRAQLAYQETVQNKFFNTQLDSCPAGPYYPRVATNVAVGDIAWTNSSNALLSDNSYATSITVVQTTQQLQLTDFRFNIPPDQQIDGILVECEAKSTLGGDTVLCRIIKGGAVSATSRTNTWEVAEAQVAYGGSTDVWGETWTPQDVNLNNFGVSVRQESGLTATLSCDAVRITVYCSVPVAPYPNQSEFLERTSMFAALLNW